MNLKQTKASRLLALVLSVVMIFSMMPISAFATDTDISLGTSGLTQCHMAHDKECGYAVTTTSDGCTHTHGDCAYVAAVEAVEGAECTFVAKAEHSHNTECGYIAAVEAVEGAECNFSGEGVHTHNTECGYIKAVEAVEGADCTFNGEEVHTHNAECGYIEAVDAVKGVDCDHKHDENCGYEEKTVVTGPCAHQCEQCKLDANGTLPLANSKLRYVMR